MNTPGSYQKAPIGTSNRLVIVWFTPGGDSVSIRTEMVAKDPVLVFLCFSAGEIFAEIGINWNHRVAIGAATYRPCLAMI